MSENSHLSTTAVIADAGMATRFLPATKVIPKGLLPIGNRPTLLYILDELCLAGIDKLIFITNHRNRQIMEKFFSQDKELLLFLQKNNKLTLMDDFTAKVSCFNKIEIIEQSPNYRYGTAAPILSAWDRITTDLIVYIFADDLVFYRDKPQAGDLIARMLDYYEKFRPYALLAAQEVPWHKVSKYGVFAVQDFEDNLKKMRYTVEKPKQEEAPSNLAFYGRAVFTHKVFEAIKQSHEDADKLKEFYIQPALNYLAKQGDVLVYSPADLVWLTTGDPVNMYKVWKFVFEGKL